MKPKILVTREIFDDVLDYLKQHFEVTSNQADTPMDAEALAKNIAGKTGP
jgi:gluconate 2-dehydrogenase